MAGSEAIGVEGARADLFQGATWVLTPTSATDPDSQALAHSVVRSMGAEVITLAPENHDRLVATVSHVPHLAAASLMGLAADHAVEALSSVATRRRRVPGHDQDCLRRPDNVDRCLCGQP